MFQKKLDKLKVDLADFLGLLVSKLDLKLNEKYQVIYLSGIYNPNRLKEEAKAKIISHLKPLIEKRIYKELSETIFENFCSEFTKKLIEYYELLLANNQSIKDIFINRGKDKARICCDKIKLKLVNQFPNDSYEIRNPKIMGNNMNNINMNNMNFNSNMNMMNNMNNLNNMINKMNINNMSMNNNINNNTNMNMINMNNNINNNMNNNMNLYNHNEPEIILDVDDI